MRYRDENRFHYIDRYTQHRNEAYESHIKLFLNIFTDDNGDNSNNEGSDNEDKENRNRRRSSSQQLYPSLQPENVVSILVSASFLKMDPLVAVGLRYVHANMNKILAATHNINCLGEPLLSR